MKLVRANPILRCPLRQTGDGALLDSEYCHPRGVSSVLGVRVREKARLKRRLLSKDLLFGVGHGKSQPPIPAQQPIQLQIPRFAQIIPPAYLDFVFSVETKAISSFPQEYCFGGTHAVQIRASCWRTSCAKSRLCFWPDALLSVWSRHPAPAARTP